MRRFHYYLYENFDADREKDNPVNPRKYFCEQTDEVLDLIYRHQVDSALCMENDYIARLAEVGLLRNEAEIPVFDCPIFFCEDAAVLQREVASKAVEVVDLIEKSMQEIRSACAAIRNGFSVEENLYHIFCGMIMDGSLFDYLNGRGALATSRQHSSGLDYIPVIYEACPELRLFSDQLLCSYNRCVNEQCSLQSFGDANGKRFDFYRFFREQERGNFSGKFLNVSAVCPAEISKEEVLSETVALLKTGNCDKTVTELLTQFGYVQDGVVCVPVYLPAHQQQLQQLEKIVEECIGTAVYDAVQHVSSAIDITAVRNGVNRLEIANEIYHIVFGMINEEMVRRGFVTTPPNVDEEGRYLKCIELYE